MLTLLQQCLKQQKKNQLLVNVLTACALPPQTTAEVLVNQLKGKGLLETIATHQANIEQCETDMRIVKQPSLMLH